MGCTKLLELSFHKEALITGRLDHPTIVPVYDLGSDKEGRPLLAMKLVQGVEWSRVLKADRTLERHTFFTKHLRILTSVAHAVAFAHSRGIIHRDLKPAQVMVGNYGEVFLMDWGLAVPFQTSTETARLASAAFPNMEIINPAGTICCMAPEQTEKHGDNLGPWTDIFLLGGMLYTILTTSYPYPDKDSKTAFKRAARWDLEPPEKRAPDLVIPRELADICMKAMAKVPEDRFRSVKEFISGIEDFLAGRGRHEESMALAAEAREITALETASYEDLSHADTLLTRAVNLWPENTEAKKLYEELLHRYIGAAVAHGDLGLAGMQAARLESEQDRNTYLSEIALAHQRLKQHAFQRRAALFATFVLVLAFGCLGYLLIHLQISASRRAAELESENIESAKNSQLAADKAEHEEHTALHRMNVARVYGWETTLTQELANLLIDEFRVPATLAENPYDAAEWRRKFPNGLKEAMHEFQQLAVLRQSVEQPGYSLSAQSSKLLFCVGSIALHEGENLVAYKTFESAANQGHDRYRAVLGMACAAFRMDNLTSTAEHLDVAARQALAVGGFRYDHQRILCLNAELAARKWKDFQPAPDDILIEPRRGGRNFERFEPVTDNWEISDKPIEWAKSFAPGVSRKTNWGSLKARFKSPQNDVFTTSPAIARYHPQLDQPRRMHVYATWPYAANASPVQYTIKHAEGEIKKNVVQDGWRYRADGYANLWVNLGSYKFDPGPEQYVELRGDPGLRGVNPLWATQVQADAVLFSGKPLDVETTDPVSADWAGAEEIQWHIDYKEAATAAANSGLKLFVFVYSTGNPHTTYCESRIFPDRQVRRTLARSYISLRICPDNNAEGSESFRLMRSGTILIHSPDGQLLHKIEQPDWMTPERLVAALQDIGREVR